MRYIIDIDTDKLREVTGTPLDLDRLLHALHFNVRCAVHHQILLDEQRIGNKVSRGESMKLTSSVLDNVSVVEG